MQESEDEKRLIKWRGTGQMTTAPACSHNLQRVI